MSETRYINRIAFSFLGIVICTFMLISLLGYSVYDWPNPDVAPTYQLHNQADYHLVNSIEPQNPCGRVGAWLAYKANYYFGPGFLVLLVSSSVLLVMYSMKKPVEQLFLRFIGILLICLAVSAGKYLYNPGDELSLSCGNGGILGIAAGHFLLINTAMAGAVMIIAATFIVGLLLAADNLVLMLPKLLLYVVEQTRIAGPVLATAGAIGRKALSRGQKQSKPSSNYEIYKQAKSGGTMLAEPPNKSKKKKKKEEFESYSDELPEDVLEDIPVDSTEIEDELLDDEEYEYEYVEVEDGECEEAEPDEIEDDEYDEAEGDEAVLSVPTVEDEIAVEKAGHEERQKQLKEFTGPTVSALARMLGQKASTPSLAGAGETSDFTNYEYPPAELLDEPVYGYDEILAKSVKRRAKILETTLREFKVETEVVATETGPVITMFELKLAPGTKVSQISRLQYDIARSLGAPTIRVVAPIPGKQTIGIEAPNSQKETVRIKELLQLAGDKPGKMQIPLFLGKDASGAPLVTDLAAMPHCLIAGTTGSGKSVCINTIIVSILLTQRPDMVKLILVDPKMVEMNAFANLAHLMCPIVTEMKRAEQILEWLTNKMDERYSLLAQAKVRNIVGFNKLTEDEIYERMGAETEEQKVRTPTKLPYLVVIIDELADLMMTSAKEVESYIVRLAQKSRAVGIHLILATQRPQATVVTGLIKSNMPARISFRVAAKMDSRIVLDTNGAETLLGQGDMLFLKPGTSDLTRCQGAFISDEEIGRITTHLKEVSQPSYSAELMQLNKLQGDASQRDELFDEAVKIILQTKRGSVSLLQRQFSIGYGRASRLIDQMAEAGLVGEYKGSQAREVLMTLQEYESIKRQMEIDAINGYRDTQEKPDALEIKVEHITDPTLPTIELDDEPEIATSKPVPGSNNVAKTTDGQIVPNAVKLKLRDNVIENKQNAIQDDMIDDIVNPDPVEEIEYEEIEDELDNELEGEIESDDEEVEYEYVYEDDENLDDEEEEFEEDGEEDTDDDEEEEFIDAVTYLDEDEEEEEIDDNL